MAEGQLILGLVGDVLVDREDPPEVFSLVQPALDAVDVLFGNLEGPYTDDPHAPPSAPVQVIPPARNLDVYARCGFDVVTMANNHIVDGGHAAMLDTRARLIEQGVAACGAGRNLAEAREPAIVEAGGMKLAFLGYASIFPSGYEARSAVPGIAPMRAHNVFMDAYDNYHAPGCAPRVKTVPYEEDVQNLREDIANARQRADLVIATFHWGDFMKPFHLTDHETRTARLCIDEGADLVVGHHHHVLRGMEWYKGKPILYGLGHFVFDLRVELPPDLLKMIAGSGEDPDFYGVAPREGWPLLPLHAESRMTLLAWASVQDGRVAEIGFVPCMLRPDGLVHPVDPDSPEGAAVVAYVRKGCDSQNLNARIVPAEIALGGCAGMRVVPADSRGGAAT